METESILGVRLGLLSQKLSSGCFVVSSGGENTTDIGGDRVSNALFRLNHMMGGHSKSLWHSRLAFQFSGRQQGRDVRRCLEEDFTDLWQVQIRRLVVRSGRRKE